MIKIDNDRVRTWRGGSAPTGGGCEQERRGEKGSLSQRETLGPAEVSYCPSEYRCTLSISFKCSRPFLSHCLTLLMLPAGDQPPKELVLLIRSSPL